MDVSWLVRADARGRNECAVEDFNEAGTDVEDGERSVSECPHVLVVVEGGVGLIFF